jgi:hypothetical protein
LLGLKENVIIGKLIPAGTGMSRYRNIKLYYPGAEQFLDLEGDAYVTYEDEEGFADEMDVSGEPDVINETAVTGGLDAPDGMSADTEFDEIISEIDGTDDLDEIDDLDETDGTTPVNEADETVGEFRETAQKNAKKRTETNE